MNKRSELHNLASGSPAASRAPGRYAAPSIDPQIPPTRHFLWLLLLPLAFGADTVHLEFQTLAPEIIQQRLETVSHSLTERKATLISLFHEAGCETAEQRVPHSPAPNLICTLPGETESTIVVGGHFDFIDKGMGAVDDWSGAVLLPGLFQSLKSQPRHHRYVFIAFAAEEGGGLGSKEYVKKLSTR